MWLVYCICIWAPCALVTARDPFDPQETKGKDHRPSLLFNHSPLLAQSVQCQYHKRRIEANQFYGALEKGVFLWADLEYLSPFSLLYFLWCFSEECARRASGVRGWKQFHGAQQHSRCRAPAQMAVVWLFFLSFTIYQIFIPNFQQIFKKNQDCYLRNKMRNNTAGVVYQHRWDQRMKNWEFSEPGFIIA